MPRASHLGTAGVEIDATASFQATVTVARPGHRLGKKRLDEVCVLGTLAGSPRFDVDLRADRAGPLDLDCRPGVSPETSRR